MDRGYNHLLVTASCRNQSPAVRFRFVLMLAVAVSVAVWVLA